MKRLVMSLILVCFFPVSTAWANVIGGGGVITPTMPGVVKGDTNGDARIDLADVIYNMRTLSRITNQTADFGDLDDATFPTSLGTPNASGGRTGPYHRDVSHEWIGSSSTSTTDTEQDAKIIDLDSDDALFSIYPVSSGGNPTNVGVIKVPIGVDNTPGIRYLNVAADFNNDGMFQSYGTLPNRQHEWIVRNLPIQFSNRQRDVSTSFSLVDSSALIGWPCMRFTLTTTMIDPALFGDNGWDGSGPAGGFARGETEDWCFSPQGDPTPTTYDWPINYGVYPPVWQDGPQQWPTPVPPYFDGPDNPAPPVGIPGVNKPADAPNPCPITNAPIGAAEPGPGADPNLKKWANVPEMVNKKQPEGSKECMPTCAANSVQYLMEETGMLGDIQDAAYPENPETPSGVEGTIFEGIPEWPNHAEDFFWEKIKEAMTANPPDDPGGMMDHPDGGTTFAGFEAGKKKASNAIKGVIGAGLTTKGRANPSFNQIFQAVSKGRDVEIVLSFKPSDPPVGHMVIVTGATMDKNGNLTLTFVDPNHKEKGEQTYTVANGAPKNSSEAENKGGLEVKNYPGAGGKRAEIVQIYEEYLTDSTEDNSGGGGGVVIGG